MSLPPRVRPGESIKADHFNRLRAALAALNSLRAGPGLRITRSGSGLVINLEAAQRRGVLEARIVAVNDPAGLGPDQPVPLAEVSYDVQPMWDVRERVITGLFPRYGRPIAGNEVIGYKAQVGDKCYLHRSPAPGSGGIVTELEIISEKIHFGACPPPTFTEVTA
jgi:hypothetical protein